MTVQEFENQVESALGGLPAEAHFLRALARVNAQADTMRRYLSLSAIGDGLLSQDECRYLVGQMVRSVGEIAFATGVALPEAFESAFSPPPPVSMAPPASSVGGA